MKKIKFLGAAILAASLIFAGCANGSDDDVDSTPDTEKVVDEKGGEGSEENGGSESGSGEEAGGEENSGEGQNSGSGESSGSGDSGSSSGGESSGSGDSEDAGDDDSGDEDEDTTTNPETDGYPVSFSDNGNSYSFANGVYTITLGKAHGADDEWGNQIFITGLNEAAGIANGDKIKTTATVKADKAITTFFYKNQFHAGDPYPGIDTSTSLEADTEKTVDIYGTVHDYNETSSLVIAIRGNEDDTTLTLKDVKVEKIQNYSVDSVELTASSTSAAFGEKIQLIATDQYGIALDGVEYEITNDEVVSTIDGNVITAGNTPEEINVVAKYGELISNELTITVYQATYSNIVLYDVEQSINEFGNFEAWGVPFSATFTENGLVTSGNAPCYFGILLKENAAYKTGAKLEIKYTATTSFAVKPVKPDAEFDLPASDTETTELIDLGDADKISKIGIVYRNNDTSIVITSIKVINEESAE